ncbi:cytochrome P450 [Calocera cornea HHB12733]|uniref:Cytochrome P450 n=1 Tax=Calocera cornea HHB12733 TaxID=1353952 RepID=A0A165CE16_9BASI|nr:cytochrome P450 [Calocera cornea HHB12733]
MSGSLNLSLMPANARWKRMRRIIHEGFNPRATEAYAHMQAEEAGRLCRYLLQHPDCDVYHAMERAAASVIFRALYDAPSLFSSATAEEKVEELNRQMDASLHAAMPLAYLVDTFPVMKHLPSWVAPWKRYGEAHFKRVDVFTTGLYEEGCHSKLQGGKAKGFAAVSEETRAQFNLTSQEAAWTAGVVFGAGSETSASTMQAFVLAMLLYPAVQKKAQAEIDAILGPSPPILADKDKLPYIQALVKETLRWKPPVTGGFPHLTSEAVQWGEYVIPKDTIIMGSIWSINHDPAVFPSPSVFHPGRFLTPDGTSLRAPLPHYHDDDVAYGHGRRLCPGRHFANNMLFLEMTYLLWAFDILKAQDADGVEITPDDMQFVDKGLSCRPADFPCVFRPRQANLNQILPII